MKINSKWTEVLIVLLIILLAVMARMPAAYTASDDASTDEKGNPYFLEMDSYYHLRLTESLQRTGHFGDEINEGGEDWDFQSFAPKGRSVEEYPPVLSYLTLFISKILPSVSLVKIAYWLSLFLAPLLAIPVFCLTRRFSSLCGAAVAALTATLGAGYVMHTVPGFFDTDMINLTASTMTIWLFTEAVLARTGKQRMVTLVSCAAAMAFTVKCWNGYFFTYGVILGTAAGYLLLCMLRIRRENLKNQLKKQKMNSCVWAAGSITVGMVAAGGKSILTMIESRLAWLLSVGGEHVIGTQTGFPNVTTSVSEMQAPQLLAGGIRGLFVTNTLYGSSEVLGIVNGVGGIVVAVEAMGMLGCLLINEGRRLLAEKKGEMQPVEKHFLPVLAVIWGLAALAAACRGQRFVVFLSVPAAAMAGIFCGKVYKKLEQKKIADRGLWMAIIVAASVCPSLYGAFYTAMKTEPAKLDYLETELTTIKEESQENTVIISWWDYGYFYEYMAERPTLIDGGSQSGIRLFWVSRALAAEDEQLSRGIFRMLTNSGDEATELLLEEYEKPDDTISLLLDILAESKEEAERTLTRKYHMKEELKNRLLLLTHTGEREAFVLLTPDMPEKCEWFSYFGFWNEDAVLDMHCIFSKKQIPGTAERELKILYSLMGEQQYILLEKEETGLSISESSIPVNLLYLEEGQDEFKSTANEQADYTLIIRQKQNDWETSLVSNTVAASFWGKLYYLNAAGTGLQQGDGQEENSMLKYYILSKEE